VAAIRRVHRSATKDLRHRLQPFTKWRQCRSQNLAQANSRPKALYKHYGTWVTQRALTLATLHAPDLSRFGLTVDQLTATNALYYPQTARWAEAIHAAHPEVEGLEWTSYRAGPDQAYVLFGDRVKSADLVSAGNEVLIRSDATLYERVISCGQRVGVRVNRPRLP